LRPLAGDVNVTLVGFERAECAAACAPRRWRLDTL